MAEAPPPFVLTAQQILQRIVNTAAQAGITPEAKYDLSQQSKSDLDKIYSGIVYSMCSIAFVSGYAPSQLIKVAEKDKVQIYSNFVFDLSTHKAFYKVLEEAKCPDGETL